MVNRRSSVRALLAALLLAAGAAASAHAQNQPTRSHRPEVPGVHGLVTSGGGPLAAMAGLRMLMKGGNAADAAVAVLATLNITEPEMSGAGGNGFLTYYDKKTNKVYALAMTGAAPKALDPTTLTSEKLNAGIMAGCVPGLFGGWIAMLDRFGTMSLKDVLEPATDYAQNGHPLDKAMARDIARAKPFLEKFPTTAKVFFPKGRAPETGELFGNTDLAATFGKVVAAEQQARGKGATRSAALQAAFDRFYKGDIAQEMARFYKENGGPFTAEDFAAYKPMWKEPVHIKYRGYDVYSSPVTSRAGLEVLMQLNLLEGFDVAKLGQDSPELEHLMIEAVKVAKADVYRYVADPAYTKVPVEGMLSKEYAASRRKLIDPLHAMVYPEPGNPATFGGGSGSGASGSASPGARAPQFDERSADGHTTSFSVVDQEGNAAVVTPTLGGGFGTGVVVGNTGLMFNNGTRIGSTAPYPDNVNYVRGGQIPLLGNSPIVVMKDGKLQLTLGTPGGETIGQTEFQTLVLLLDFHLPMQEAVEAPRFAADADPNFYKPGSPVTVSIEGRFPEATLSGLRAMGHKIAVQGGFGSIGSMQGILVDLRTGTMTAGADPRRQAYAIGW